VSRAARHASAFVPADRRTDLRPRRRESTGWRADVAKRTKADDELQKYRTELARLKRQKERAALGPEEEAKVLQEELALLAAKRKDQEEEGEGKGKGKDRRKKAI